jgi:hypothetical protein
MLKITSPSGDEFQMVIVRYQFPDVHEDRWDSNWLIVNGSVSAGGEKWRFTDPCVTTFELADLADWLDELADDGSQPSAFEFTEPNLKFGYTPWPERAVQLTFAHESAPPTRSEVERRNGITVEFPLSGSQATALAVEIRQALTDYPIRGGAA